jgi:hypothetical protein
VVETLTYVLLLPVPIILSHEVWPPATVNTGMFAGGLHAYDVQAVVVDMRATQHALLLHMLRWLGDTALLPHTSATHTGKAFAGGASHQGYVLHCNGLTRCMLHVLSGCRKMQS